MKELRGYCFDEVITLSKGAGEDVDKMIEEEEREHLHEYEEARIVLEGSGYFDVRDRCENFIRIEVKPGDMLIIPAGLYHRCVLDEKNNLKFRRLFPGLCPDWTPYYKPDADKHPARKRYVTRYLDCPC
ncbi:hypothetical protein EGW08_022589 [Elysia chlorotica]|uniref:acireductone dioxygenase (Fe(2+)-requiring) n=1 Tax=Elysia chlorotica TaxID=188477 RepID=A0A3S1AR12_ELYCH|nr:hypothetical protein EGW08_022589 [Elysia chlorotica]